MSAPLLFPFAEYWWLYAAFTTGVVLLLLLDLGVFHREAHAVSIKEASAWSAVWISLALAFNVGLYFYAAWTFAGNPRLTSLPGFDPDAAAGQVALEFLTGFVIEKSLAVDNIFVFVVLFSYFAIPAQYQHRVLFFGILGALVFRAVFIALGATLLQYHWVVLVAGAFLILTGLKILATPDAAPDPGANPLLRLLKRILPVTPTIEGPRFFVRRDGVRYATPLFLALAFIEFSDIVFAIDSVPAIFAITAEPLIVFTSNIFAILGLRSLYFLLAGVVERFHYLKYGLGLILIFVGLKMTWLNEAFGGKFPIGWSLGIIAGILAGAVLASWLRPPGHPGSHGRDGDQGKAAA
ncbi:MAG: TerC family protein [bacterium]|nr:TerC family protein [bacterium]